MLKFVKPGTPEWARMWSVAVPGPDKAQAHPANGESWQYMGSTNRRGRWEHEFRHRNLPGLDRRVYAAVPASDAWVATLPN